MVEAEKHVQGQRAPWETGQRLVPVPVPGLWECGKGEEKREQAVTAAVAAAKDKKLTEAELQKVLNPLLFKPADEKPSKVTEGRGRGRS
ncbi:hypothetical protein CYMTET_25733 [Cymbomonas tetramitiformis]|uniref:Uncharacterized protein n=1 Tax=Cymbomonas tetramitiformis TaxID=36881 RepID=A0AAE0KYY1_9CHLO|nr:hypothetical protein CYMTET_25733 [Cymbomonas tetramitiformis]